MSGDPTGRSAILERLEACATPSLSPLRPEATGRLTEGDRLPHDGCGAILADHDGAIIVMGLGDDG